MTDTELKYTADQKIKAGFIPVMEHFYTIQGEGAHTGKAAYFVRLAGCDVGCVWCDVKESWEVTRDQWMKIDDLILAISQSPSKMAVITGGEPLMYDLTLFTDALINNGFRVHIETSGAYPARGHFDWVCLSPKKFKFPLKENYRLADELKVIIFNRSDFKWAEEKADKVSKNCKLFLQPEWDKRDQMMPLIVDYVKEHPRWQISLQTHKYLQIP